MSIRKEDLHQLIDLINEHDTKLVYDLIKVVIEKDIIVEADNSPLTMPEREILKQAFIDIENDELLDWDNIHG